MKDVCDFYIFTEQAYRDVHEEDVAKYPAAKLEFPNSYFDPVKAHQYYNEYHELLTYADEVGWDGVSTNEHHSTYRCMKPSVNVDAAVLTKITKRAKILMIGNVPAISDPLRLAEEIAMLDCYSGGRIISGFVRGTPAESLHSGINPVENWERFTEGVEVMVKTWTTPGPFRWEGKHFEYRNINPWVLPMQKPHPPIWFGGTGSADSVIWAARHGYTYGNVSSQLDFAGQLRELYMRSAHEAGRTVGPENFAYVVRCVVADTEEKAQELGRLFFWHEKMRFLAPAEHADPPGYQTRQAAAMRKQRPEIGGNATRGRVLSFDELQDQLYLVIGTPSSVIGRFRKIIDVLNPGHLQMVLPDPIGYEDARRSIQLFGEEVIPALKEIKLRPYEAEPALAR